MKIAVVGAGWLGLPLALSLQKRGYGVVATRRSVAGVAELLDMGLNGLQFELARDLQASQFDNIFNSDVLFLNIPVGRNSPHKAGFVEAVEALLKHAKQRNIQHVLLVSTTSVYGNASGKVNEHSSPHPETESAKANLAIELLVKQYFAEQASIIRLAGLVGDERHPVKFLAGKTSLPNAKQVVNLIHQQDIIKAIHVILLRQLWGETFLLCATEYPSREEYYTWAAKKLDLPAPQFLPQEDSQQGKSIDASQSLAKLGIQLTYSSPYQMLPSDG
ncbi:SDR family oxidoreductase [Paraglaciecola aquimarina]|uniref:SDR family oxidoreductase n=1 Tax=Paraglaciecola aquimarina TaxID=1235557 RepID=A0ABU3ST69_9ALTE|nr:SDR family oxidoreductase [Paraglaciecola aquimarina]MDU0353184.1 SDR family oxidoreductase [Paraglaciecola aquimarina]